MDGVQVGIDGGEGAEEEMELMVRWRQGKEGGSAVKEAGVSMGWGSGWVREERPGCWEWILGYGGDWD